MKDKIISKKFLFLFVCILLIGISLFFTTSPYISNTLKKTILPELEDITGKKVTAQKISINLVPLFIEAKDMKILDENNGNIVTASRVRGYLDLSAIFEREISIQKLIFKGPDVSTDREQLNEIIKNVKTYLEKEKKKKLTVKIKAVEITKGTVSFRDAVLRGQVDIEGLAGEVIFKKDPKFNISLKKFDLKKAEMPELTGEMNTSFILKKDGIDIKSLEISSYGSQLKGRGFYSEGKSILNTDVSLFVDSVKRLFNLKQKGTGRIFAKGEVKLKHVQSLKDIFLDLKLSGNFYLQTLMELLKVKEKLEGFVDFEGELKGPLSDISGKAEAKLKDGNLFGIDIDSLSCIVSYYNGLMKFEDGAGSLYNGKAQASASLKLPGVEFYTLYVKFLSVDSNAALKLIGWEPDIPKGKVEGEITTSGNSFNPDGWFVYKSLQPSSNNVLGRIRDIKGNYSMRNGILSFGNLQLNTLLSDIKATGTADVPQKTLNLQVKLTTNNISDLSLPYYTGIKGYGDFSGKITGPFHSPRISGSADAKNASIEGYTFDTITSVFSYEKNLLDIHETVFKSSDETHTLKGKISFPEAKELFELSKPVYNLEAKLTKAEFGKVVRMFYKDFSANGILNASFKLGGIHNNINISGKAFIEKASVYNIPFDSASINLSYANKELSLEKIKIIKGKSILNGECKLSADKTFSYRAISEKFFIKDIGLDRLPGDATISVQSEGHGTFDNPDITLNAKLLDTSLKGSSLGGGILTASIKNKDILLNASLFNEKLIIKGNGHFDDTLPWNAEFDINSGRYDFIISSILKDVPEDLHLDLKGHVTMKGDKKNITASANLNHITLSLFGQNFSNDSDINFSLNNRNLALRNFTLKSGTTSLRIQGSMEIGKQYDVVLDGSSSLSPLKGLSKKIGYLKGDADFVFSVNGKWEKPQINGGMNLSNASFGLRDYPSSYISSIYGYLYVDENRIVLQRLSGKIGGGDINVSGVVYLEAFSFKRFYVEANMKDVTAVISKDFNINYDGNLLYKGTMDAQSISGDIKINRAKYKEMIEWRSWLLTKEKKEKPRTEASVFDKAELNIRVTGSNNISIDNNMARAPIKVDIVLKGTLLSPVLIGRLESSEGYAYFRNNEFRIIFASADFTDLNRINPYINLTAETTISGYDIRLILEGQLDHFNLSLSSDPHLEESDILSLLTVGQLGKQTQGLEKGIGAGEATTFLTGKAQDVFEERLRSLTGLDRFQVEPYVSKTTGAISPRVTVSKRLIGDRLFVTYATLIGETEEQVLKLEYRLDKNISLIGTRDELGSIGGDIKFRFEFK